MQELKLNIYKMERDEEGKRLIEKTYTATEGDLLYGPIEDILGVLDLENIESDEAMLKVIVVALKQIKPIFKDVFWGLTDEELRRTSTNEIVENVLNILKFVVGETALDSALKNVMKEGKK